MAKKTQERASINQNLEAESDFSYTDLLAQSLGSILDLPALASNSNEKKPLLVRRDILQYEEVLCRDLARFINFEAHSLYFPTQDELPSVQYLDSEKKLLLPLRRDNALLGIILLRHVSLKKSLLPFLPALAQICLDKIYHIKLSGLDERCNLMRFEKFIARTHKEIYGVTQFFTHSLARSVTANVHNDNKNALIADTVNAFNAIATSIYSDTYSEASESTKNPHKGQIERQSSVGLMVLPVLGLDYIRKFYGFTVAEQLFVSFSQKIKALIPEDALCTILDGDNFAVLFPGATRLMMEKLASQCILLEESMDATPIASMFTAMENVGGLVEAKLCAGYALFPQDWDGMADSRDSAEIPHLLLRKASIAAERLKNTPQRTGISSEKIALRIAGSSLAFRQILLQGGNIETILPYSQVRVTLGSEDGAQESMCFSVWADREHIRYKGEILLRKVGEKVSEAEILMLSDPAKSLEEGDFLQYVPQSRSQSEVLNKEGELFYAYRDFMNMVNEQISTQNVKKFSLALVRIQWEKQPNINAQIAKNDEKSSPVHDKKDHDKKDKYIAEKGEDPLENPHEDFMMKDIAQALDIYLKDLNKTNTAQTIQSSIGSMSFNSLIIYHPNMDGESIRTLYENIGAMLEKTFGVPCAVGIASYPFLGFRPADMWDACRKALDYAMLLPMPHVGIFDSLAMNISADRKFSQGDIFGAVEEYRMALLADEDNILAWNSLGICLAELGRHVEARNSFEVAYARQSKDAATCYNLGAANLALEDRKEAKEYFLACLMQENNHLFARIRLGEIAEKEQDYDDAFEQYTKANHDNPESSVPYRCLAKLYMLKNQKERARELLQLALQKNAEDAVSLQFLAGLYLDGGEDAELAELLARQSVALLPWRRSAWAELARALEAQSRFSEAAEVRRKSMRL